MLWPRTKADRVMVMFEALARALARFSTRRPRTALAVVFLAVLAAGAQGQPEMANDDSTAFAPDEPSILAQRYIADNFQGSGAVTTLQFVVSTDATNPTDGGEVINLDGLAAVEASRQAIADANYNGTALADLLTDPTGNGPVLSYLAPVEQAMAQGAPTPTSDEQLREMFTVGLTQAPPDVTGFVSTLLATDAVIDPSAGTATSPAGLVVAFLQAPDTPEETDLLVELQAEVLEDLKDVGFGGVTAIPFSSELIRVAADEAAIEIPLLLLAALGIIGVLLLIAYFPGRPLSRRRRIRRTMADTGLTLLVVLLAIVFANGMASLLGPAGLDVMDNLSGPSNIVPILLVGLGVDYVIHLNANYRRGLSQGEAVDEAMSHSARIVGGALALSSITTIVGFLTNLFSGISGLVTFGVYASIGIAAAFLISTTLFPASRLLLDRRAGERLMDDADGFKRRDNSLLDRVVGVTAILANRVPAVTVAAFVATLAGAGVVASNLETEFSFVDFVPENSVVRDAFDTLVTEFGGVVGATSQVLVRDDVTDPAVWNNLVDAQSGLADVEGVVVNLAGPQVTSPVTVLAGLLDESGPTYRSDVAELAITQGFDAGLRAGPDTDIAAVVAAAGSVMDAVLNDEAYVVTIGTRASESDAALQLAVDLEDLFGDSATATSQDIIDATVVEAISNLQIQSVVLVVVGAALFVALSFLLTDRRPMLGVLTVLPVGSVVIFLLAFMVVSGIPLGPVTATLAAVVIGIGVDYTIHITHRYLDFRREGLDIDSAIQSTLATTGAALVVSALTTGLGFAVLLMSSLIPFQQFGALTIFAVFGSALVSVTVLPSLLVLWDRLVERRRGANSIEEIERSPVSPV